MEIEEEEIDLARRYVQSQQQMWAERLREDGPGEGREAEFNHWSARFSLLVSDGVKDFRRELVEEWAGFQREIEKLG